MHRSPAAVIAVSVLIVIISIAVLVVYMRDGTEIASSGPAVRGPVENPRTVKKKTAEKKTNEKPEGNSLSENIRSGRIFVRHILVAYKGARDAGENIKTGKEEAYNRALKIRDRCREHPDMFEKLAEKYSNDRATAGRGGLIPPFELKDVHSSFRDAITGLGPGGISNVVETPFGFHIIKREHREEAVLQSICIPFKGALHAGEGVLLSREQARSRAFDIRRRIVSGETLFADMARKYSRDPWAVHGGFMRGVVTKGHSIPHREIEKEAFSLEEGEISPVFSSPLGFHIIKRHRVESRQACHIVVYYGRTRPKHEARKIINRAYTALQKKIPFQEVVKTFSEEKNREKTKGFTHPVYRGTWIFPLEEKLFSMDISEISKPIELENAFVIIARVR